MATPVSQLPEILQTEFWHFSPEARQKFLGVHPFEGSRAAVPHKFERITLEGLLDYMRREEASYLHEQQPSILHNATDLSQPFSSLGIDTRALRCKILSTFDRYKQLPASLNTVQAVYDAWLADFQKREREYFVRQETTSWEVEIEHNHGRYDLAKGLTAEYQWCEFEGLMLHEIAKHLEELRDWDSRGAFPKVWERTSVRADQLPQIAKTEFWAYTQAARTKFLERTRPYELRVKREDAEYRVTHLTKKAYEEWLRKQSILDGARADILQNARDAGMPYAKLGRDTAKLRVWLRTGLERLSALPEGASLAEIYSQWAADVRAREQAQYVRSEMIMWEHQLDPDACKQAGWQSEHEWAEEEGAFLSGVCTRLNEIRNLNEPLLEAQRAAEEEAKREEKKKLEQQKREAEQQAKKQREEEERAAQQKAKEEAEAKRKQEEEEREKKIEEQKKEAEAAVSNTQNKMAMYQAELKSLQEKMMKGEIDGAAFGAAVGGLSKKYFS